MNGLIENVMPSPGLGRHNNHHSIGPYWCVHVFYVFQAFYTFLKTQNENSNFMKCEILQNGHELSLLNT